MVLLDGAVVVVVLVDGGCRGTGRWLWNVLEGGYLKLFASSCAFEDLSGNI